MPNAGTACALLLISGLAALSVVAPSSAATDSTRSLSFTALPTEAQSALDELDKALKPINKERDDQIKAAEERCHAQARAAEDKAIEQSRALKEKTLAKLVPMMNDYAKKGLLDEALAIRDEVQRLRTQVANVMSDPGSLKAYQTNVGRTYLIDLVGRTDEPVWGSDVYTGDSSIATAAVHAGLLSPGQRGIVRATMVDMKDMKIEGTTQNGVTTRSWDVYPAGYRLSRP